MDLKHYLNRCPIIAILRGVKPDEAESICSALENVGIAIVEVPLNSPDPFATIPILSRVFGSRILVGAGTVTTVAQVHQVKDAGGRLIVTPHADSALVKEAKAHGMIAIPGFFTPTEAFSLLQVGADAIKMFPSEVLGIPMFAALKAVLPANTVVIPVGGISAGTIVPWMTAGAIGFGAASSIYKPGDDAIIATAKASALLAAVREFQAANGVLAG
jgi:2-dehydro-3-deoxyphosphogalactonate aldolase